MRHHTGRRLQFRLPYLAALALQPEGANLRVSFLFQSTGKIDDRAARIARPLPVITRTLRVGREEGKVHVSKPFSSHALDEVDFVARRFELADRLVIIEQANVHGRKVALVQHLGDFFPFKRGSAHDSGAEMLPARGGGRGQSREFWRRTHEVCEASL